MDTRNYMVMVEELLGHHPELTTDQAITIVNNCLNIKESSVFWDDRIAAICENIRELSMKG